MYRALESERPDALFRDAFARRLAGPRGEAILDSVPGARQTARPMAVRTRVFDEIILRAVRTRGATRILNLGAGLDARPYRLDLPGNVDWIEVDLPRLIARKERILARDQPRCRLERVPLDLSDAAGRRSLLERVDKERRPTLVVTEGLLLYMKEETVVSLAEDLREKESLRWWLVDFVSPDLLAQLERGWGAVLRSGGAAPRFALQEGAGFFAKIGWNLVEERFLSDDARRLKREMPFAPLYRLASLFQARERRERSRRYTTFALLGRD